MNLVCQAGVGTFGRVFQVSSRMFLTGYNRLDTAIPGSNFYCAGGFTIAAFFFAGNNRQRAGFVLPELDFVHPRH
jgi:hypothetical protein